MHWREEVPSGNKDLSAVQITDSDTSDLNDTIIVTEKIDWRPTNQNVRNPQQ